jgi:hypothetical protein
MHVVDQYGEAASDFLGATRKVLAALRLIRNMRSHLTCFTTKWVIGIGTP